MDQDARAARKDTTEALNVKVKAPTARSENRKTREAAKIRNVSQVGPASLSAAPEALSLGYYALVKAVVFVTYCRKRPKRYFPCITLHQPVFR